MTAILKDLKDDDLLALAEHFSRRDPKRADEPVDPTLVNSWVRTCRAHALRVLSPAWF